MSWDNRKGIPVNIAKNMKSAMMPTMDKSKKPLVVPPRKKLTGLVTYCYLCGTNVYDTCKKSGKPLSQCKHGDRHVFKKYVSVPGTKNERKTKTFQSRDINEVLPLAIQFEQEVKGRKPTNIQKLVSINRKEQSESTKPILLLHVLAKYVSWLSDENVPTHLKKGISSKHIKEVRLVFQYIVKSLKEDGFDLDTLLMEDINDDIVGTVYNFINKKNLANATFNRYFRHLKTLMNWYKREYDSQIRNWFEKVVSKDLNLNPESIPQAEYLALLNKINKEDGVRQYSDSWNTKRSFYRPWLADGIRLGLETGRRLEEIANLKWDKITESEGVQYIEVEDYKVNRIQKRDSNKRKKLIYIPVTESLRNLLMEMGYEQNLNTDQFILAPEVTNNRRSIISNVLSRGFSHYYDLLDTGKHLTFKCLRKTYLTSLELYMGSGDTKAVSGHSTNQVIEKHYIDKREIAKAARGLKVFGNRPNRNDEIKEIRNQNESNQNPEIEI